MSLRLIIDLNDPEQLQLPVQPEYPAGQLPQKLLQHTGNRVHRIVLHIHQTAALQKVYQLLDGVLVARRPEYVLAQRCLLVDLQDEHEQWAGDARFADLVQRHTELDLFEAMRIGRTAAVRRRVMAARCDDAAQVSGTPVHALGPGAHDGALWVRGWGVTRGP